MQHGGQQRTLCFNGVHMQMKDAVSAFLLRCESVRRSSHTLAAYRQDLREFLVSVGECTRVTDVAGADIDRYHQLLRARNLSPATIKRRLACLRSFFNWLVRVGGRDASPFARLDISIRLPERLPRALTAHEVCQLLAHRGAGGPLASVAIGLLLATGMRVSELVSLRVGDVDFRTGKVQVIGKGDRQRVAFVTDPDFGKELEALFSAVHRNRFLLRDRRGVLTTKRVRRIVKTVAKAAGITRNVTPHMLRHTAATMLIERRTDIRFVQQLLGHRSITTTQMYTTVTERALREALARANILSI